MKSESPVNAINLGQFYVIAVLIIGGVTWHFGGDYLPNRAASVADIERASKKSPCVHLKLYRLVNSRFSQITTRDVVAAEEQCQSEDMHEAQRAVLEQKANAPQ